MLTATDRNVIIMLDKQRSTFKNCVKQRFHFPKVIISIASTAQKKEDTDAEIQRWAYQAKSFSIYRMDRIDLGFGFLFGWFLLAFYSLKILGENTSETTKYIDYWSKSLGFLFLFCFFQMRKLRVKFVMIDLKPPAGAKIQKPSLFVFKAPALPVCNSVSLLIPK